MEKIKNASIKRAFICAVLFMASAIVLLSVLTVFLCHHLQKIILPDSNEAVLSITGVNEMGLEYKEQHRFEFGKDVSMPIVISYSDERDTKEAAKMMETAAPTFTFTVDRIDNSFSMLSPKRKTVYMALAVAKIALPLLYSVVGIVLCAAWFYRKKLSVPISLLSAAAENIAKQNLDFQVSYESADEMGLLCGAFEKMRQALCENNKELWGMIEGRRALMASVAHDLRNPISIMEGYLEYLQEHLASRNMEYEDILNMVNQIMIAAKRLERYTDSLRSIHFIEEQELQKSDCKLPELIDEMSESFLLLGQKKQIDMKVNNKVPVCSVFIDVQILYRILENVISNALRFAANWIHIDFELRENHLIVQVTDDGAGFNEKLLEAKNHLFFTTDISGEHIGMGLAVCDILSRKHGGSLTLSNLSDGGAGVTVKITVSKMQNFCPSVKNKSAANF